MTTDEVTERLDRLESLVEQQQDRIERQETELETHRETIDRQQRTIREQRKRIAELESATGDPDSDDDVAESSCPSRGAGGDESPHTLSVNRRTVLQAGGILGLLSVGTGTAVSEPSGQVGTQDTPLNALYTESIDGGLTGDTAVDDLSGDGLEIDNGALTSPNSLQETTVDGNELLQPANDAVVGLDFSQSGAADVMTNGNGEFLEFSLELYTGGRERALRLEGGPIPYPNVVAGDQSNTTDSYGVAISGGRNNAASALGAVGGGESNTVTDGYGTVSGGQSNKAGENATVGGGRSNEAGGQNATVGGGDSNAATASETTVGGGADNTASAQYATVDGGDSNTADSDWSTVGGGYDNTAQNKPYGVVGGGSGNTASALNATVPGGLNNTASGSYSFAAGREATASNDGAVVFGDSTDTAIESSRADEARFQMELATERGVVFDSSEQTAAPTADDLDDGEGMLFVTDAGELEYYYNDGGTVGSVTLAKNPNL